MLHNTAHIQLMTVIESININFNRVRQELVNKQRRWQTTRDHAVCLRFLKSTVYILLKLRVFENNLHTAAAQNIRWAHKHWITDGMSSLQSLIERQSCAIARSVQALFIQNFTEKLTVFSQINSLWSSTQNWNTGSLQSSSKRQRSLSTKLHNHALNRTLLEFSMVDFKHIFEG